MKKIAASFCALTLSFFLIVPTFATAAGTTDTTGGAMNTTSTSTANTTGGHDVTSPGTQGYGANAYSTTKNTTRAHATDNKRMDWGWLGLLGLFGLAGMKNRSRETDK